MRNPDTPLFLAPIIHPGELSQTTSRTIVRVSSRSYAGSLQYHEGTGGQDKYGSLKHRSSFVEKPTIDRCTAQTSENAFSVKETESPHAAFPTLRGKHYAIDST
jgi:hypothetical protein